MQTDRQRWLGELLAAGLKQEVFSAEKILGHISSGVLARHLPRELMATIFATALDSKKLSAPAILKLVPPSSLAEHVPEDTLWSCVAHCADVAGFDKPDRKPDDEPKSRGFFEMAFAAGTNAKVLSAEDIVRHVDAGTLGSALPPELQATLLDACLIAGSVTPQLIVDTLTVAAICRYVDIHALWACVADVGSRASGARVEPQAPKQAAADAAQEASVAAPAAAPAKSDTRPEATEETKVEVKAEVRSPVEAPSPVEVSTQDPEEPRKGFFGRRRRT